MIRFKECHILLFYFRQRVENNVEEAADIEEKGSGSGWVISGFQARALAAGFESTTEWSLQISGQVRYPRCHRGPGYTFFTSRSPVCGPFWAEWPIAVPNPRQTFPAYDRTS
ncbi:hypothetical protein PoB_004100300 [Plakobranchus ocellatus]|uniref:Uncharacterized protein n=1 Tax=Plakobranchus ocellatus TaxID=259542 RepID=A0AAV4B4K1_9GAST|nr:hypothetical protein PoB_004100300 [Plakobranchus ocellatus]